MLYKYQEDFFKFHLEDEKASENFDYNLEGIITLYDKGTQKK